VNDADAMPPGRRLRRVVCCEFLHGAALSVWIGATVVTGAAAAVAFPVMKALDPMLPGFSQYPKDHWAIAAGHVMYRVFALVNWLGIALSLLACGSFACAALHARRVRSSMPPRGRFPLRATVLGLLLALTAWNTFALSPGMNRDLRAFWDAARAGRIESADAHRAAFDERHPIASRVLGAQALLASAALILGCRAAVRRAPCVASTIDGNHES